MILENFKNPIYSRSIKNLNKHIFIKLVNCKVLLNLMLKNIKYSLPEINNLLIYEFLHVVFVNLK